MLKKSHGRVCLMEGKLLDLSWNLEAAQAKVKKVEEALVEETRVAPEKGKKAIAEYNELCGLLLGL